MDINVTCLLNSLNLKSVPGASFRSLKRILILVHFSKLMNRIKIQLSKLSTSRMIGSGIHAHCGIRYAAYLETLG